MSQNNLILPHKKSCFSSSVRITPEAPASSSPDLSSPLQSAFPGLPSAPRHLCRQTGVSQWHSASKLPHTVTGSYRILTGFSLNPCGTCSSWFENQQISEFSLAIHNKDCVSKCQEIFFGSLDVIHCHSVTYIMEKKPRNLFGFRDVFYIYTSKSIHQTGYMPDSSPGRAFRPHRDGSDAPLCSPRSGCSGSSGRSGPAPGDAASFL